MLILTPHCKSTLLQLKKKMLALAEGNSEHREHRGPENSVGIRRRQRAEDLPGQSREHVKAANIFQVDQIQGDNLTLTGWVIREEKFKN